MSSVGKLIVASLLLITISLTPALCESHPDHQVGTLQVLTKRATQSRVAAGTIRRRSPAAAGTIRRRSPVPGKKTGAMMMSKVPGPTNVPGGDNRVDNRGENRGDTGGTAGVTTGGTIAVVTAGAGEEVVKRVVVEAVEAVV
ncbi:hypothetical protein PCASD_22044, partial [Puccinia coronata f. sp. avenae]